jgi:hypothetical protein
MSFNQGEFNFNATGPEDGYRRWRAELDAKKRAFETRWGVILGRTVCVTLRDHVKPLSGILEWVADAKIATPKSPQFRIKGVLFTVSDIESIVQVDSA